MSIPVNSRALGGFQGLGKASISSLRRRSERGNSRVFPLRAEVSIGGGKESLLYLIRAPENGVVMDLPQLVSAPGGETKGGRTLVDIQRSLVKNPEFFRKVGREGKPHYNFPLAPRERERSSEFPHIQQPSFLRGRPAGSVSSLCVHFPPK